MIVKKLAVPLINEKILNQVEYCYIATASISDAGFDFIRGRIPPKCKMEILTGLDVATSPDVLKRMWRHYQERILLKIYTKNFFHANLYIFDLPFRKSVAFVGSGHFTLEGLKDNEELFERITDPKEIEALKSWFVSYYEFAEQLTEEMINEYDLIYPSLKQREIASRQEKREVMELTTRGFNWDAIKFKNQYFKKEDYLVFSTANASLNSAEIQEERARVQKKLEELNEQLKRHIGFLKLQQHTSESSASVNDLKVKSFSLRYGRREAELKKYDSKVSPNDFLSIEISIHQKEICLALKGNINSGKTDREYFRDQLNVPEYKTRFFQLLTGLGAGYSIEVLGERKGVETFLNEEALLEFVKSDDWRYYAFSIGKNFLPGDTAINIDNMTLSFEKELDKLIVLYDFFKHANN
jgi:hypothetical protein